MDKTDEFPYKKEAEQAAKDLANAIDEAIVNELQQEVTQEKQVDNQSSVTPLTPTGMFKGESNSKTCTMIVLGKDHEGRMFSMAFSYPTYISESLEKYFTRMSGIEVPKEKK